MNKKDGFMKFLIDTAYSFRLPLCLWYDSRSIASAALLMGYHGHDIKFPADTNSVWGQFLEANSDLIGGKCLVFMKCHIVINCL